MDFRCWYVIFVMTGHEEKVRGQLKDNLAKQGLPPAEYLIPKRWLRERNAETGEWEEVLKVMFPGYVLVGTDEIEQVAAIAGGITGVLKFLKTDDGEFYQLPMEEISWIAYMTEKNDVIEESEVYLDEDNRIVVQSGPLKGEEGRIKRFNRRSGRVAVEFLIGAERRVVWLGVRVVSDDVR